ncbi:PREDICTED: UDP-glycosyltransferase 86A1-like [Erythranthe guttata]|uniref:UDP-glycosyltransferase 86A1-like n=1 Tax=Erythranthe guttata TaxID=4155 RepID=UPI00064E1012|nr:PREDICTED: UDP-glycosyltransferase 86A1-like [Erythranthe guttata]|eukprot:XP_012840899.1 PREDICTED: UDP-glycosyltransferase 86A1-like [Erythranthe guttata]
MAQFCSAERFSDSSKLWTNLYFPSEADFFLGGNLAPTWVIRPGCIVGSSDNDVLPFGFEDEIRIKDRGLIIPRCDQIKILSNRAVGGFLTHNGWNSTVESMWCGVPMICYPIDFDQVTNRKLEVDDWKIGINLCDNYVIKSFLDRKEVAEKIKSLMSGTISERLRQQVDNVKKMLRNAVEIDGSSERNFVQFIDDLRAKIIRTASNVVRQ